MLFFIAVLLLFVLGRAVSFLSSPPGYIFLAIFVIGAVAFLVWRYYRKQAQKQRMIAMQQQEYARQQWVRQEWERQERERREQERLERERQEREKLARLKSLGDILILTPTEFEELTGKILTSNGLYDMRRVGGSGDLGADLIALDEHGKQVIVQCKRYAPGSAIGSRDIQNFIGMMNVHHKAEKGIFVTTSKFTKPAIDLAEKHKILLIDGDRFLSLMQAMQGNLQPN
jgi:restriction endonuclease Mrr